MYPLTTKKEQKTPSDNVHLVILKVVDIDFVDLHYFPPLSDAEKKRFENLEIGVKPHYCAGKQPVKAEHTGDPVTQLDEAIKKISDFNKAELKKGLDHWNAERANLGLPPDSREKLGLPPDNK
mmetsp:Transcript_23240/g.41115  ORF Transcript_23240/g.41115 Transcript_23240/m.41115 type:complete len:123 (-) Transcript_23240:148-516(-)